MTTLEPPHSFRSHDGTMLRYQQGGHGSRVLIAVHGAGSNHTTWLNTLRRLRGIRWYAFDTRGHGKSGGVPDVKKSAEDVLALADAVGARHFIVAGICYGGTIAIEAARKHPGRITKAIFISPLDRQLVSGTGALRLFCAAVGGVMGRMPLRPKCHYVNYCQRPGLPLILIFIQDLGGTNARHYAKAALQSIDTRVDFGIKQPLLVVTGSQDIFLRNKLLRTRLKKHGKHVLAQVAANHHVLTWQPRGAAAAISRFLKLH